MLAVVPEPLGMEGVGVPPFWEMTGHKGTQKGGGAQCGERKGS